MSKSSFFFALFPITALSAVALAFLAKLPAFQSDASVLWISLAVFALLSIGMYFMGLNAAKSDNKNTFTSILLLSTMAKMFIAILIIVLYLKLMLPDTRLFVLPFLGIYLIFTVFETYFMMKLGKMDN